MFRHHEPASPPAGLPAAERERRAAEQPADFAIALQRAAGNHATGRVLSRYTAGRKGQYEDAARQPPLLREMIAAVLAAHKSTFEFKGAREPLLQPLEQWLVAFEATLRQWEQTTDAEAEAKLVSTARSQIKDAGELRGALYAALGNGDPTKGKEGVEKVLTARKSARADEEARQKREAEAAAKKEADDKRRGELAADFPIAAAGPAYPMQPQHKLARFHEHVTLSHPAFSGLSLAQLRQPTCPLYLLTAEQLARVQTFAGAMRLSGWKEQNTPRSRQAALGFPRWIVPTEAVTLKFELGGELFADLVVPNPNHGFTVGKLMQIWSFVSKGGVYVKVTEGVNEDGEGDGRKVYENQLRGRTETRVVTARNDAVLITCFDTGRR